MSQVSQGTDVCTEYARTLIRVKARQIVRRPGFSRSDTDDVEQDLFLHLLNQIRQVDPSRGSLNTFIARVVDSAVAMLVRERGRNKRAPATGVIQSLEVMVDQTDGPPSPLGATLSQDDAQRRTGVDAKSHIDLFELAHDIAHLIDALPPELQMVCRTRMDRSRAATQQELGLSRKYDAAIKQIRERYSARRFRRNLSVGAAGHADGIGNTKRQRGVIFSEKAMTADVFRFLISRDLPLDDAEVTLQLAVIAAESLFGSSQIRLDFSYHLDRVQHSIVLDGTTETGAAIVKIFTGFLQREFRPEDFQIQRIREPRVAA